MDDRPGWDTRPLRRHLRSIRCAAVILTCDDSCLRVAADDPDVVGPPTDDRAGDEGTGRGAPSRPGDPAAGPGLSALPDRTVLVKAPGCLADVEPAAILECAAMGSPTLLSTCGRGSGPAQDAARTAQAAGAETFWVPGELVAEWSGPVIRGHAVPVPRRVLLGRAEELEELPGHPQERLTAAVRALCEGRPTAALSGSPGDALRLQAPGCHGDGLCVRACPQDALTRQVDGEGVRRFALLLDPARCDGCGKCLQVCPHQALRPLGRLSWAEVLRGPVVLRSGLIGDCERCGAPVRGSQPLCHVCAERAEHPFGMRLPPGFVLDSGTGVLRRVEEGSPVGQEPAAVGPGAYHPSV
ncbi:4Fe-4S dicluster domain-containing protein [Austwickia chelonae]|uniref:4Fe-4S ferredoxin-type domain-containing protein n=1 Tax=Austwickia chelonae NBRC 105200 TaxID=1184607 RepID=K6VPD4_9MICO|nr:4Fe-4S dicluster domain-containing protein [Austwickia chelonae]GAB78569.1 hypothetical protein AUCHE_12_00140 [Austwickia chelonae NBRC 105200]SEW40898.1 4Fe-4S dicluster domain-containing protein [Austwickia chelonae]